MENGVLKLVYEQMIATQGWRAHVIKLQLWPKVIYYNV